MKNTFLKRINILSLIIILFALFFYILQINQVKSQVSGQNIGNRFFPTGSQCPHPDYNGLSAHNITGWMYSEYIGWISLNCLNDHDPNSDGIQVSQYNYGVDINWTAGESVGYLSGWAWSPNIGWISFDRSVTGDPPFTPFQSGFSYIASIDKSNGSVQGWARAINGLNSNNGGWDGWIRLSVSKTETTPNLTISKPQTSELDKDKCQLRGWAWGDELVGWLSLNCDQSSYGLANNCPGGTSPISDYAFNITPVDIYSGGSGRNFCGRPPIVSNPSISQKEFCETPSSGWDFTFTWTYNDPDGEAQKSVQIQTSSSASESGIIKTYGPYITSSFSKTITLNSTDYPGSNVTYYYRVRATDQSDLTSQWSDWNSFTTPIHPYPKPDFSYLPLRPAPGETVSFTNNTQIFGGASPTWNWNFGDGNSSTLKDPTHSYATGGSFDVRLTATQSDLPPGDNSCYIVKTLPIRPRPIYKYEQTPGQ